MYKEASSDLIELKNSLSDTAFELTSIKYALDEAAIVAITDIKGTITYVNKKFCEISKYSSDELIGQNHRIINSGYHPIEFFQQMYRTIGKGNVWRGQIRNKAKDGTLYWVDTTIVPLKDRAGKPTKYLAIRFDISEQKKTEEILNQTLTKLENSNKELEQFAYIASHDLREPLRMVTSYAQLIARRYREKLDDEAEVFIKYLVDGTNRMQMLIDGLLLYSRTTSKKNTLKQTDLNVVLQEVLDDLKISIEEKHAEIKQGTLPNILADPIQIRQLFQNLISNAIKYNKSQTPIVEISSQESLTDWCFSVKDNGIGIEQDQFDRIFKIFQRLHRQEEFPGTGIGLAVCKKIIERHEGRIWIESYPGKGSVFYFTIPKK
ncbi:MAG: ATP-binding protein [Bacteroidota bacterium]|nr:ATP-binding protein [Bacteroidota bacterium]